MSTVSVRARSMRASLCLLGVTVLAAVSGAAVGAEDELGLLMKRLAERRSGLAQFVEQQYLSVLKAPVESSGELYFEAPDHLEKRTLSPRAETVVIDRGTLTIERGAHRRSVALASYPQLGAFIESIRATLAGDRAALESYFRLELRAAGAGWELLLGPRDARLAKIVREIRIGGHDDVVDRVEIVRVDGDRSIMTITAPATPAAPAATPAPATPASP